MGEWVKDREYFDFNGQRWCVDEYREGGFVRERRLKRQLKRGEPLVLAPPPPKAEPQPRSTDPNVLLTEYAPSTWNSAERRILQAAIERKAARERVSEIAERAGFKLAE